jgi:beta-phosphoglucomutase-like phosphatase (HAD superfamily)
LGQENLMTDHAKTPAFIFDLDGTLIDSVYQHVLAWREALERAGTQLSVWRIHRRIGMSGGLLVNALLRETGSEISTADAERLQQFHAEAYKKFVGQVRPLPGAADLLAYLAKSSVPHGIATSGRMDSAGPALKSLGVSSDLPVITRDQVRYAKPDPDLFLAAADRLGVSIHDSIVVGVQCLGSVSGTSSPRARRRTAFGRLRARGVGTSRSLPRLPGPAGFTGPFG